MSHLLATTARLRSMLALACLMLGSSALAQQAKVRTNLQTHGDIWVGQKVTIVVELLAPGYFASAPAFDLPDPKGVLLLPPSQHPVVGSETIDDKLYTVQRHELSAYPMEAGSQSIPALTIRFSYKPTPLATKQISASVKTTPQPYTVKMPPGAENRGQIISARDLKVEENWQPEPDKVDIRAGDAFTRTVTYTSLDVPGMLFPPFVAGQIDGVGIYTKHQIMDHTDRGSLKGERRDVITYVCERPGQFVIPAARFSWFDLKSQELRTVDLPARTLNVLANPALASGTASNTDQAASTTAERLARWSSAHWWQSAVALIAILLVFAASRHGQIHALLASCFSPFRPWHLQPLNPVDRSD